MSKFSIILRIALIIFLVEGLIMIVINFVGTVSNVALETFLDALALTLFSSPLIYYYVIHPYVTKKSEELNEAKENAITASERHLNIILDNSVEAIVSMDENQQILYFNKGAEKMFGYAAEEVIGKSLDLLLPDPVRHLHHQLVQGFATSPEESRKIDQRGEISGLRKDGTLFSAEASISKIETAEGTLFTAILHDNEERKRAQKILQQAHDELEQRVQERTTELNEAKLEAESANQAKSEFLSRMSHELRTPMNAILGFGQLLELDNENMNDEQKEGIDHIMDGGHHLLALINDVLDIAKIDVDKVHIENQDVLLDEALNAAVLLVQSLALKRNIKIQVPSETRLFVRADPRRLIQVLVNLISNAAKYNHVGGKVSINVVSLPDGRVRISIIDNGYGIKNEDQAEIFEPFHRISDKKENIEGTGIGLTITKKLIEAMGGRIGFESEYNKGSTFWIELLCASGKEYQPLADIGAAPESHTASYPKTILYIEDNQANLKMMQQMLKRVTTSELLTAVNAEDGIEIAKRQQPDLILMDINLPGMDGYAALEVLKADDETAHIPVIAVSAHAMPYQVAKGKAANFVSYLTKPVKMDELTKILSLV